MCAVCRNYNKRRTFVGWIKNLICLVEKYPIIYVTPLAKRISNSKNYKQESAWEEIASKLGKTCKLCKFQWRRIQLTYAKITILINTGKINRQVAISHPNTGRYFDGLLSFLDSSIGQISDDDIPGHIHKSINNIFKTNFQFVTHAQVRALLKDRQLEGDVVNSLHTNYLQTVVDNVVERKLLQLLSSSKNVSANSGNEILNNVEKHTLNVTMMSSENEQFVRKRKANSSLGISNNILNKDEENRNRAVDLGLQSEIIIDDDIKMEITDDIIEEIEDVTLAKAEEDIKTEYIDYVNVQDEVRIQDENVTSENKIYNENGMGENYNLQDVLPVPVVDDTNVNTFKDLHDNAIVAEDTTDNMADNTTPVTDEHIRHFFNELGVVMSMELSLDKQKTLKTRINDLLKSVILNVKTLPMQPNPRRRRM